MYMYTWIMDINETSKAKENVLAINNINICLSRSCQVILHIESDILMYYLQCLRIGCMQVALYMHMH